MSLVIETFLLCDVCSATFGVDSRGLTGQKHRLRAATQGWIYSGNKDFCPNCRPKNKDGKIHGSKSK